MSVCALSLVTFLSDNEVLAEDMGLDAREVSQVMPAAIAVSDSVWSDRLAEAESLRDAGQFADAIAIYQALLAEQPSLRPAREGLALTYVYSDDYESGIELYEQLITDYPEDLELWRRLAEVYGWQGNYARAIALYESILERTPNAIEVRLSLAETISWAGDYDEAINAYDQVIASNPDSKTAWLARPQVAFWASQPDRAIALYESALVQYPDEPELLLGLAQVYQSQQQFKQAIAILQPLIDSQNPQALAIRDEIRAIESVSEFEVNGIGAQESFFSLGQTLRFRIDDGPTRQSLRLGYTTFNQRGFSALGNTNLQVGVEGQINTLELTGTAGVDLFSRLPATPILGFKVSTPVTPSLTFTGDLSYSAYKENVDTLENQIAAARIEPALYWQIDSKTSLFLFYGAGFYSDGNLEHQTYTGLEHQFGNFFVSASVFYWSFADDPQTGYFSPSSYLLYGGELGWLGSLTEQLNCRFSASLENQVFSNTSELANTYQGICDLTLSPKLAFNLGYQYSTNAFFSSGINSASQTIQGQMNWIF